MNDLQPHAFADAALTLEKALRDGSRPVAFLVGAGGGCSIYVGDKPLIPAIKELTVQVREKLAAAGDSALPVLEASLAEDGIVAATVEDWLTRLRTLLTIVGDSEVRGLKRDQVDSLESAIVEAIASIVAVDLPEVESGYSALSRWGNGFDRSRPLEIFTLSYDLLMEQALERAQYSYFDGFLGSFEPFLDLRTMEEDTLPARWTRLWKLHGSINWKLRDGVAFRTADWRTGKFEGALIHPSHLKYDQSRRMPYLAMQDRLRAFLRQPGAVLITVGYSFGDQHINELVEEGLRVNAGSVCFGLLYENLDNFPEAKAVAERAENLRIYARDAGVIGLRVGTWVSAPDAVIQNLGDFNELGSFLKRVSEGV
jgi:hypothetical protein